MKAREEGGVITTYTRQKIPTVWKGIRNFNSDNNRDLQRKNGFFEVEPPVIGKHQKRGALYFDTDVFKYTIINFTPSEIEEAENRKTDAETDRIIQDGIELHAEIRRRIVKAYKKGVLSDNQIKTIKTFLKPAIAPLKDGDWIDAQTLVNALPIPGNSTLLAVLNEVKNLIDSYIIDNNIII